MTIQEAIEKAIAAGYRNFHNYNDEEPIPDEFSKHCFLDPQFWKSLGNAMGWDKRVLISYEGYCLDDECNTDYRIDESFCMKEWLYQQHLFIDHLAEGKSAEEFFEKIKI